MTEQDCSAHTSAEHLLGQSMQDMDIKEMLADVKDSLHTIDTKNDLLTSHIDHIKERVGEHNDCLDHLEYCTSDVEDSYATTSKHLFHMAKVLGVIKLKNEDLEMPTRRNNRRILGIAGNI
ncbi:hypothetical protein NDU88_002722 [Pleurodeles waltl]|uniref:Uncharacterized protein n=1 Tax=Pleurodeles waltl TaxID=8319 RepID=A0AAV7RAU1_PLEWA|nr:hypothetical protein NDU88_002722 [Pleurodeles waltl]